MQVWGYIVTDFSTRVQSYFDLRSRLEKGLPPMRVTEDVAEIRRARQALAKKIQAARHGAQEGDIFSPAISAEFKEVLALEMNASTWAAIMEDNPGEFSHEINGIYRTENRTQRCPEPFSRPCQHCPTISSIASWDAI